jgi:myo-inositol-1(or 4)-monophosphatase
VSEERGVVHFGSDDVLVVIDPIDGSMNAKRGIPHIGISIAVAAGTTMADVVFGYVADLGTGDEWTARLGEGVVHNGEPVGDLPGERRNRYGKLELVAIESADPQWIAPAIDGLQEHVHRIRAFGSIAISLCQVALARVDGMVTLWRTRAVDCAAAQLIVRESGGFVEFPGFPDLSSPLDTEPHGPLVAARTRRGIAELSSMLS